MFTSIPYDEGWNIYVDGKKVETYEANDSLISFYVEGTGEHTVEMKYMPKVVALGIGVSLISLAVYILILLAYPFIKKVPVLRKLVMIEGEELPEIASPEYMAEIEEGDIGAPVREKTPEEIIAEAGSKYGKVRESNNTAGKKPTGSSKSPASKGKKPRNGSEQEKK
jgi:hypothetical protein